MFATILLALALLGAPAEALASTVQVDPAPAPAADVPPPAPEGPSIMNQVLDQRRFRVPGIGYVNLPPAGSWMVGPVDLTPTKYVVFLWLTGALVLLVLLPAGRMARRSQSAGSAPRGGHGAIEAMILFFRDQVVMPNIGAGGERFAPLVITLFFFILFANLLGLIPYGASATASISVTATLALISLIAIEWAGIRSLGSHYWGTIFYWNRALPLPIRIPLFLILTPVEILGKFAKPFALAIRLMANMVAGKIVIYSLLGLIFIFGSYWIAVGPVAMTIALMFLKIFVAFLQAYIFALLTSVFIGLIRHAH